jgi:hypothetical protein
MIRRNWVHCLGWLLSFLVLAGCRSKADVARSTQTSHLRSLITIFNYAESKLGHRPKNEAELKSFITTKGQGIIDSLKLGSVDELFVSERDGQPFTVLYDAPSKGEARDIVAYEQTGVAGKRLIGYSLGAIAELDEEQFAKLAPPASQSVK